MDNLSPDEIFEGPGFTMKRRGRFIEVQTRRTPEEQARLLKTIWRSRETTRARIQKLTDELADLIHKYSSFDVVANLWLRQGPFNADAYKETESTQRPHFVEHAVMLQLKDSAHELTLEPVVPPEAIARAEELLTEVFGLTVAFYSAEAADPRLGTSPPSTLAELRFKTLLREMMVGPPAYTHHWARVLEGLFGSPNIDHYLNEVVEFNLGAAISCSEAIGALMGEALLERSRAAQRSREEMKQQLIIYMRTGKFEGSLADKSLFDTVRNMRSKERKRFISSAAAAWVTVALSDVLSFTPQALALKTGLAEETASKFLAFFSLTLGSTPSGYTIPAPVPPVRARPIVHLGGCSYLCPLPFNLIWAIKPRFEEALKQSSRWNAYQKQRAAFLVDEGLRILKELLPASETYHSLTYPIGPGQEAELDGLVLFDRYAFLLEAKAGEFGAARRGGQEGIKRGLKELVGDPSEQGVRAWDYIRTNETPTFVAPKGAETVVDKTRYTEVSVITLTLDSLDVFTPELHRLHDAGVLGLHDLPWAVCLTDLIAITTILRSPTEFTHFLRWRLAINEAGRVSAGTDELNWLAIYLKDGPQFLRVPEGFTEVSFTSYVDSFDAYFLYQGGFRDKPAERPIQPIPERLRDLIATLESSGVHGFTAPGELLLSLTFEERESFARKLGEMERARRSGKKFVTFEAIELRIVVYLDKWPAEELHEELYNSAARDRTTLALAVDSSAGWRVANWLILPSAP